ncbi:urease accessory protein UreD [Oceanobacter mangrovi]|uniref:urease accessory protein UreD n=1 Tax=Oceanobacter mangrovi TaxID=2862510 RepID=UPI001C8E89EB|nr:urease accessory protein UreD [Oceanobacter mangrovi]
MNLPTGSLASTAAAPEGVTAASPSRWDASLTLGIEATARGSVLKSKSHQGPLYIQKPFYPEGRELAHLYLLHPPGGMVSGDTLAIAANLGSNAAALITTPGAGRVYKARADKSLQRQIIEFNVADNASLEWLPLESIIYPGAVTRLETRVNLHGNARYIGWEVTSLGLPAAGKAFDEGSAMSQSLNIWRDGRLCLRERLVVDGSKQGMLQASCGLKQRPISGTMVAGPFGADAVSEAQLDALRALCDRWIEQDKDALAGVTLNHDFLIVRYLGSCSEQARKLFGECWAQIRPLLLAREACAPRIWAT